MERKAWVSIVSGRVGDFIQLNIFELVGLKDEVKWGSGPCKACFKYLFREHKKSTREKQSLMPVLENWSRTGHRQEVTTQPHSYLFINGV